MVVHEIIIAGAEGIEIPNVEVDDVFALEVRVRVFAIERDLLDVSGFGSTESLPGSLRLKAVAATEGTS